MPRMIPTAEGNSSDEALQEIDDLLEELARLTRSGVSPQEFHAELLDRAIRGLAAVAGAFWVPDRSGGWQTDARADQSGTPLIDRLRTNAAHGELLQGVLRSGQPRSILPGAALVTDGPTANPSDYLLLLCPIVVEADPVPVGVLEVVQRAGASPATQQGYLRFLAALCDLASDYHQQRLLRLWQDRAARLTVFDQFSARVHASLGLTATAAAIANEGRRATECDRVTVAMARRDRCRVLAVSGQEQIDPRANVIRRLEDLTGAVIAAGIPFWLGSETRPLAPQIAGPLEAYLDEAHPQTLAILPIRSQAWAAEATSAQSQAPRSASLGALIVERFTGGDAGEAFRERVEWVGRQGGLALANALNHESLPFFPLIRALHNSRWLTEARQLPRTMLAAGAVLAIGLALVFIPADFEISGEGALQPEMRREVFAGSDGIVAEVRADHGDNVHRGDTLILLTRSQLDFEMSRVLGETQTARKRLAGVTAARLESSPQTAADRDKYNQLAAEEEELKELLANLAEQQAILRVQQEELVVKSPIEGQVITWNARELLESRPVQRGQALLTVADLAGPWVLEIEVADDKIGHVLAARQALHPDLDVAFMLATTPGTTYRGSIEKVALATDVRRDEAAHVLVTVRFDRNDVPQLRPGATAIPRIHCGRRALGYVWFHALWEAVQKHVLF